MNIEWPSDGRAIVVTCHDHEKEARMSPCPNLSPSRYCIAENFCEFYGLWWFAKVFSAKIFDQSAKVFRLYGMSCANLVYSISTCATCNLWRRWGLEYWPESSVTWATAGRGCLGGSVGWPCRTLRHWKGGRSCWKTVWWGIGVNLFYWWRWLWGGGWRWRGGRRRRCDVREEILEEAREELVYSSPGHTPQLCGVHSLKRERRGSA